MTAQLEIDGLSVAYGQSRAVTGLSLNVPQGGIVSLLGPNGAGKSTTLNAVIGLLEYDGHVRFNGQEIDALSVESRVEAGLCLVPETRELFSSMSVEDNLILGAYILRRSGLKSIRARLDEIYGLFPRLAERRAQIAGTLSGGERQMLALGRALMLRPSLLMLDEPSLGLAPAIVRDVFQSIASLRDEGVSVLVVEQNARIALEVSDYAYVLENGELTLEGSSQELAGDGRLVATYLGGSTLESK